MSTRRSSSARAVTEAISNRNGKLISCVVCGGPVFSSHKHYLSAFLLDQFRRVYASFRGLSERLRVGLEVCCLHFVEGHPARVTKLLHVREEPANAEIFVSASREDRRNISRASKRPRSRSSRGDRGRPSRRKSARKSLSCVSAENPDIQLLVQHGVPAHLFPVEVSDPLTSLFAAVANTLKNLSSELQRAKEENRTINERSNAPLQWGRVGHCAPLSKSFTGLSSADFDRVLVRYRSVRSHSGRREDSICDEDRVLLAMAWLGRSLSFKSLCGFSNLPITTIQSCIESVVRDLAQAYGSLIALPSLEDLAAETCPEFYEARSMYHSVLIPDGTSLVLHNPLRNGKSFYCAY